MRNLRLLLSLFSVLALSVAACKKSDSVPDHAQMQVIFSNEAGGQPVQLGSGTYRNASGNQYSVDLLKYYITNFTLIRSDGVENNFKTYKLIDASVPASQIFTLDSVKNGDYTSVRFFLGVDYDRNHTGAQDGDLDPSNGMIWSWNTGYIFFKHEGSYLDSTGVRNPLVFHYGSDKALVQITLPLQKLTVSGAARKLYLRLNMDSLYDAPRPIDFNVDNNRMSTSRDDAFWLGAMGENFSHAFQYVKAD